LFDRRPITTTGAAIFHRCGSVPSQNCVVDGDTFYYRGVKIRLADIDAPETVGAQCLSEAALGERAKQRLLILINLGPFTIVRTGRDEDVYGRKLRMVHRNGRSLGDTLVAEGLARPWDGARRGWCGTAFASNWRDVLEKLPLGRSDILTMVAWALAAAAATLIGVRVWSWRTRKKTIEQDFNNVLALTRKEGKEAVLKRIIDRQKCSRLEAKRIAVEEWRHDANRW
jgi:hypothetical protein